MPKEWYRVGIWAAPLAWTVLAGVGVRSGRLEPTGAAAAAAIVLLAVGAGRAVAPSRGGLAGRVSELLLVLGGVAWLVAEPAAHRTVVGLAVALAAGGAALLGAWPTTPAARRPWLAMLAGAAVGAVLATGVAGAPWWGVRAVLVVAFPAAIAYALARVVPPALAAVTVLALGAALGPWNPFAWVLPLLAADALWALGRGRWVRAVVLALAAAAVGPAGVAVAAGLLLAAARRSRSPLPLLGLPAAVALAWWLQPAGGGGLLEAPTWAAVTHLLPLGPLALPWLLPAAVAGLLAPDRTRDGARELLGAGLLLLPLLGSGAESAGAAAAVWLGALPAAGSWLAAHPRPWLLAFTCGAAPALLLLAPWGLPAPLVGAPLLLTGGWALAMLATLLPHRATALAWVLPAAGLVFLPPVEGVERPLAADAPVALETGAWVALVGDPTGGLPPRLTLSGGPPPVAVGRLDLPSHRGWEARRLPREVVLIEAGDGADLVPDGPILMRTERAGAWHQRERRAGLLTAGAIVLLAVALLAGVRTLPAMAGLAVLVGGTVAAGSGLEPVVRAAFRGAPDVAAAVWAAAALALLPALRRRRFVAGLLLLAPLALAQPLLRPPAGDEVYHVQLLESLRSDGDLDIADEIDPGDPSEAIYLPHVDRLIHSPLLALLLLPLYAALGLSGALLGIAAMVAGGAALTAAHADRMAFSRRTVDAAWLAVLLTYPALTFATQLWPAAAAILLVGLLLAAATRAQVLTASAGAALGLLIKVRFGLILIPLAVASLRPRRYTAMAVLLGATLVALAGVAFFLGGPLGRHAPSELVPDSAVASVRGAWGLAWDAGGGLALSAPLWLAALLGLPALWRRGGTPARALVVGAGLTLTVLVPRPEWFGGGSPPARYLVPLLPLVLLLLVQVLRDVRGRRLVRLLVPMSALAAWVAVTRPLWLYNPVDGGWWLGDALARGYGTAARRIFPSVLRPNPAVWIVPLLLLLLAAWWVRQPRRGAAAVTLVALMAAVGAATGLPEFAVHAEDPQVLHLAGSADPPPGTPGRAAHRIAWRLPPGGELEMPWHVPEGRQLQARVRVDGGAGTMLAGWGDGTPRREPLDASHWQPITLPPAPAPGRQRLHLRWEGTGELLVDLVEAAW